MLLNIGHLRTARSTLALLAAAAPYNLSAPYRGVGHGGLLMLHPKCNIILVVNCLIGLCIAVVAVHGN